ncbi:MAG TPA: acetate kinase [Candidatus Saccharicenans sp.]|jgi:acetate kinase|nr:acetate kinase [Candidatus Saccharicenans sp.]HRD01607.1 acetate kinase [Candidatus Saccharicenans sp.]
MNIFVLNCGSSSVKFQIINTDLEMFETDSDRRVAKGLIERVGKEDAFINLEAEGQESVKAVEPILDHREAILRIKKWMEDPETKINGICSWDDIHAIGHRVVHGGEKFTKSVKIDKEVLAQIEECSDLAPLHNPANLKGIYACYEIFGDKIPQVAIFDTAFHSTVPGEAYMYAIPIEYYEKYRVRRYGFHGTSHRYLAYRYRKLVGKPREEVNIITLHLGNGCSAAAIKKGYSVNTSMGLTPLEGLIMGTRSGDIDPAVVEYLYNKEIGSVADIFNILNKKSGMLGVSGLSNDMRDIEKAAAEGNHRAQLALKMFALRVKKYIGAYLAEMNGAEAIIFSAGIGENSALIRKMVCEGLDNLGIELDEELNQQAVGGKCLKISKPSSRVAVWVIPTNEELLLARDTVRVVRDVPRNW